MAELRKKIYRNLSIQTISRVISVCLWLLAVSLMMRYLGPERYGYYSIAIAFLQIFGIVADFGLYLITLQYLGVIEIEPKEKQQERIDHAMSNLFTLRFFLALIFYGLAVLLSLFFPYPPVIKIGIFILSFSLFFCTLIQFFSSFYQKMFETGKIFKGEVLGNIISLSLIALFIIFDLGFYFILLAFVLANLVNFLILFFSCKKLVHLRFSFDFSFWREIFSKIWPIGLAIALNVVYFKADTLILSFYAPPSDVGFYGAAYRIFEGFIALPLLFLGLVIPQLAKAWASREKDSSSRNASAELGRFRLIFQKSFDFLVMIAVPFVFGSIVVGFKIMELIGGPQFKVSGELFKVISLAAGLLFVGELFKQLMIVLNKQKNVLPIYFAATILALVGYFIFIPLYSYWGAAWTTVGVEFLMLLALLWYFYKQTHILPRTGFLIKSIFSSLIMFAVLSFFKNLNLFILIGLGIVLYFSILFLLKGISKEDVKKLFSNLVN